MIGQKEHKRNSDWRMLYPGGVSRPMWQLTKNVRAAHKKKAMELDEVTGDEVAGEQWLILQPEKWNKQVQYAWRFDPCELVPRGAPRPPPRRPQVEQG